MKTTHSNIWTRNKQFLVPAFLAASDEQTAQLIVLGLAAHIPEQLCNIVDIGGGGGRQAVLLAQMGHNVTVVDVDPAMLNDARQRFNSLDTSCQKRLNIIEGTAENVLALGPYDIVCCHSVIPYEEDWRGLVRNLTILTRSGGILSIMAVNPEARAMRLGRQRRWREVIATITTGRQCDLSSIQGCHITRTELQDELVKAGVDTLNWYGVGVFEDGNSEESLAAEWLAGTTDPYKSIARCYHVIGQRI